LGGGGTVISVADCNTHYLKPRITITTLSKSLILMRIRLNNLKRIRVSLVTCCIVLLNAPIGMAQEAKKPSIVPMIMLLLEESEAISEAEASRFLIQASYGPTYPEIVSLTNSTYSAWLDKQFDLPATKHVSFGQDIGLVNENGSPTRDLNRFTVWVRVAMDAPDQLRQRMAYALSQFFVVSDNGSAGGNHEIIMHYYDLLVENAFSNYRELLGKVTLNGSMGGFLSMAGNQRANPELGIARPDENYAREIMQLFSIGTQMLNIDGTLKLDRDGNAIPTYEQRHVEALAKVFTGWYYNYISSATYQQRRAANKDPMIAFPMYHDTSSKTLLSVPGFNSVLPAGQSAEKDLNDALDLIFNHPNVGPFISKQLIQRFVSSNPSPAYVARVARVFNNNGRGVRGDLQAVIKTILLDNEARKGHIDDPTTFGRIKEPILRATALWRGVGYLMRAPFGGPTSKDLVLLKTLPLDAPSVFNFYRPDFSPPGALADNQLVSPESELLDIAGIVSMGSAFSNFALRANNETDPNNGVFVAIDTQKLFPLVPQSLIRPEALVDRLNTLFLADTMPNEMRDILLDLHDLNEDGNNGYLASSKNHVVNDMLYLVTLSPYFYIQR